MWAELKHFYPTAVGTAIDFLGRTEGKQLETGLAFAGADKFVKHLNPERLILKKLWIIAIGYSNHKRHIFPKSINQFLSQRRNFISKSKRSMPGMVACLCNPSTQQAEAGGTSL
jgi:hypothetical protein